MQETPARPYREVQTGGTPLALANFSLMRRESVAAPSYVIRTLDLDALNFLDPNFPRPLGLKWINRWRNTQLQRTTVEMLVRILFRGVETASIVRLHEEAGLRVFFRCEADRRQFAKLFKEALANSAKQKRTADEASAQTL
jgi:hypothetical protein